MSTFTTSTIPTPEDLNQMHTLYRKGGAERGMAPHIVYADADCDIYSSEQREIFENSGAADKTFMTLEGADHYLNAAGEEGDQLGDPRERLIEMIVPWMEERIGGA